MSKKIISISYINDSVDFVEVERTQGGDFMPMPSYAITNESLMSACERADEIYVNSLFPSAQYDWETFPKVEERYFGSLITSFLKRKRPREKVSARLQQIKDLVQDGSAFELVALQSIEEKEIKSVLELLHKYRKKVKFICAIPAALAAAVKEYEKVRENTILLWCRENISVFIIMGPDGLVKIARILPYGLPGNESPEAGKSFAAEVDREIMMTVNYFKQKFRQPAPEQMYMLGDERLQSVLGEYSLKNFLGSTHFSLRKDPRSIDFEKLDEKVHLLGSLYVNESFNFLPVHETLERKMNRSLSGALVILVLVIGLLGLWTFSVPAPQSNKDLTNQIRELEFEIDDLQDSITRMKPIEGRKRFYQSAFLAAKPEFINILQQIGTVIPDNMIFDSFTMAPAEGTWHCMIAGKIKGKDWQERLDTLRNFGRALYSFSNVDIQNINHSLGEKGMDATSISFQMSMQFIPGEQLK